MSHVGPRLRKLRLNAGLTQQELAAPRYSAAYVSTIEASRRIPSKKALEHFARGLGVDAEELASGRSPGARAELLAAYGDARRILASGAADAIEEAETRFGRLARRAKRDGFPEIEAKAWVGVGLCAETASDLDGALSTYEQALALLAGESVVSRVDAIVGRARVLQVMGEVAYAAFLIEQAIAELRDAGMNDPSSLLRLHSSLVAAYSDVGLIDRANSSAEIALGLAVAVDDAERLANMNLNVGIMLTHQGQWREAETRFADAERWFDELHFAVDLARVRLVRGINLRNQQRYDDARPHLEAARDVFASAGNALREARATLHLGILERLTGRAEEARFVLKRAIALSGDDKGIAGIAERELALCHAGHERAKTVAGLRKAIQLLQDAGIAKELAAAYRALGDVLSKDKELKPACDAYRKAADLFERAA